MFHANSCTSLPGLLPCLALPCLRTCSESGAHLRLGTAQSLALFHKDPILLQSWRELWHCESEASDFSGWHWAITFSWPSLPHRVVVVTERVGGEPCKPLELLGGSMGYKGNKIKAYPPTEWIVASAGGPTKCTVSKPLLPCLFTGICYLDDFIEFLLDRYGWAHFVCHICISHPFPPRCLAT